MKQEKEREKFWLYKRSRDPKLREELINDYRQLAEHIARQFLATGEPLEDLIQVALIGLIKAVDGYDPDRGTEFTTFAWYHIRGEVSHYLRDQGKIITEPGWVQEARIKVERARNVMRQKLKREPTTEELIEETRLKADVVKRVLEAEQIIHVSSLDEVSEGDEEMVTELDRLVKEERIDIEQRYLIRRAVEKLPELQQKVIELLFWEDLSQREVARMLGISVTYVSYLFKQARTNLRRLLGIKISPEEPKRRRKK